MKTWRKIAAFLLIVVGMLIFVRGTFYAIAHNLGWQGIFVSSVAGVLIIALGVTRWRYWQGR